MNTIDDFLLLIDQAQKDTQNLMPIQVTHEVKIGGIVIGGNTEVKVQSMTSGDISDPSDVKNVADKESDEAIKLAVAGSELVRIAINSKTAMEAVPYIRDNMDLSGYSHVPLIGCGQFEIEKLLADYPNEARRLDKIRINPGNIGFANNRDIKFEKTIENVCKYNLPVRIGVNWGSLDKDLVDKITEIYKKSSKTIDEHDIVMKSLIISCLLSAQKAEEIGLSKDKIILSCKVSKVLYLIELYNVLAKLCKYPLHLGLTEVGFPPRGLIATSVAFSPLLLKGIGSTIRASLTQRKVESRADEVYLCKEILHSLEMRAFHPTLTSCPGCGRAKGQFFREVAEKTEIYIKSKTPLWQEKYHNVEKMTVAVMGCTVNGPGESKHASIGISLPGYQEKTTSAAVYMNGKYHSTIKGDDIANEFCLLIDKYVEDNYLHK